MEGGEVLGEEGEQSSLQEILKFIFCVLVPLFYYPLCFRPPWLIVNLPIEKNISYNTAV